GDRGGSAKARPGNVQWSSTLRRTRTVQRALCFVMLFVTHGTANAATCVLSGGSVNFGVYNPVAVLPTDGAGTVSLQCNWVGPGGAEHVAYVVTLSTGVSGGYVARTMVSGADTLTYNLYVDAARTQVWETARGAPPCGAEVLMSVTASPF